MDYRNVLLVSEDYLKSETLIDINIAGKFLLNAIKLAQDVQLQSIIGTSLLESIQKKILEKTIDLEDNKRYKELLDYYITPFLSYQVLSEIIIPVSYKISNFGVMQSSDEKDYTVDNKQVNLLAKFYLDKANVYKKRLQDYVVYYRTDFPELNEFEFPRDVYPNLYSSSSCNIWLGGERGKGFSNCNGLDWPNKKKEE